MRMNQYLDDKTWPIYHIFFACVHAKSLQSCLTLQPHGLQPAWLLCPWDSLGKNTGVGCHSLLQGIFPRIKPGSSALQADFLLSELSEQYYRPYSMVNRNKVVVFRKLITLAYLVHIAIISLQSKCRPLVFPGMLEMQNLRHHSKFLDSESVSQQDPQRFMQT